MKNNKRYIFLPFNKNYKEFSFYDDLQSKKLLLHKNDIKNTYSGRHPELDNDIFNLSNATYFFVGFLEMNEKYWTSNSNALLMFLQKESLVYSCDLLEDINFSSNCLFSTFKKNINTLNKQQNKKNNLFSILNKTSQNHNLLSHILKGIEQPVFLKDKKFTKNDFQPIFFTNDTYLKHPYVKQIYNDTDNIYYFIKYNFELFIRQSSLKEEYKDVHFLDIEYDLAMHFSKLEDAIIFHDYFSILNSASYKFMTDLTLSMLKQVDTKEITKIKNYFNEKQKKHDNYLLYILMRTCNIDDDNIANQSKIKYIKLIENFKQK